MEQKEIYNGLSGSAPKVWGFVMCMAISTGLAAMWGFSAIATIGWACAGIGIFSGMLFIAAVEGNTREK